MINHILKSLASLFTLVGGHFLNRRFDRAILVFAVTTIIVITVFYSLFITRLSGAPPDSGLIYQQIMYTTGYTALALLIFSAILTYFDSRKAIARHQTQWSVGGGVAAVLTTFISLLCLVYLAMMIGSAKYVTSIAVGRASDGRTSINYGKDALFATAYFGGTQDYLPYGNPPPKGPGYLLGVVEYDGLPAVNVKLDIILNDTYKISSVPTDDQGQFSVPLPKGNWLVNRITAIGWRDKPQGEFVLVQHEKALASNNVYSGLDYSSSGKLINIQGKWPTEPYLKLELHKSIEILSPSMTGNGTDRPSMSTNSAFKWQTVRDAHHYQVEIYTVVTREGVTKLTPVLRKRIEGTSELPLSQLKTIVAEAKENPIYTLKVVAFDQDGRYLTESTNDIPYKYSFTLQNRRVFVAD